MKIKLIGFLVFTCTLMSFNAASVEAINITPQDHTRVINFVLDNRSQIVEWLVEKGRTYKPTEIEALRQILRMKGIDKKTYSAVEDSITVLSEFDKVGLKKVPPEVRSRIDSLAKKLRSAESAKEMMNMLIAERDDISGIEKEFNLNAAIDVGIAILKDGEDSIYSEKSYEFLNRSRQAYSSQQYGFIKTECLCCITKTCIADDGHKKKVKKHAVHISGADIGGAVTVGVASIWTGPLASGAATGGAVGASAGAVVIKLWNWVWDE